jgi:hypothetical protein
MTESTDITSKAYFPEDVSCCLEWRNSGGGTAFGSLGDGAFCTTMLPYAVKLGMAAALTSDFGLTSPSCLTAPPCFG